MTQLITLRTCLTGTPKGLSYLRESVKLSLRALLQQRHTRNWLQLLNSHPLFGELVKARPRMIQKIYRPYLSNTMNCQQRLAAMVAHYRFVVKQGLGPLVAQAAQGPVQLLSLSGKSGAEYTVALRAIAPLEREGELVLQLLSGQDLVYSVAFSFLPSGQRLAVGIGCVQGPQGEDGLARIRECTRELHGLRPKNLMVRLVRQLGHDYGCQDMLLVGNDNRAVRRAARRGRVFADYDALWQELGAQRRDDGDFHLACEDLAPPLMEEIPSKKRSEVRKRHALLEGTVAALRARLEAARHDHLRLAPAPQDPAPLRGLDLELEAA